MEEIDCEAITEIHLPIPELSPSSKQASVCARCLGGLEYDERQSADGTDVCYLAAITPAVGNHYDLRNTIFAT